MKLKRHKLFRITIFLTVIAFLTSILPGHMVTAANTTFTFKPTADAYVISTSPSTNYGKATSIRVDNSPVTRSYLRFSVSGLNGAVIQSAKLRVYANSSNSTGYTVKTLSDNTWSEGSITYSNSPAPGTTIKTSVSIASKTWTEVDVSADVKAEGSINFALITTSSTNTNLASRESSNSPQLVVVASTATQATATPGSQPTATKAPTQQPTNVNPPAPTATKTPIQATTPGSDWQPSFPMRAAFYYPWFPEAWNQQGYNPFTNYSPVLGYYSNSDSAMIKKHIDMMQYGNIQAGIASWWGQGSQTDNRIAGLLSAASGTNFRWSLYYENESMGDPSASQIQNDLTYILNHYGKDPSFLRVNGKFVVFVYADGNDSCSMADRWKQGNTVGAYIVLKVFAGYANCASQPDSWHQYSPAVATDHQGSLSYAISPGFWKKGDAVRLARDLNRWNQNVKDMVASGSKWQLITTFSEWGEGTVVEPAQEWASSSGYGQYLDVLHANGNGNIPPQPTATNQPTTQPTATQQVTSQSQPTATKQPTNQPTTTTLPTATNQPTNQPTATAQPTATNQPTNQPTATAKPTQAPTATLVPATPTLPAPTATQSSNLTPVVLTKGPDLLYSGSNTQMKLFWQWTANTTFRVDWGTSTAYGSSSPAISAYDSTNHLYAYTITGLTPATKYNYRVVLGSQYSGGTFLTAPADNATAVNFLSYGDNRTNPSIQNSLAGMVDQLMQSDPSYQTFNLVCGDLVSNGDTDSIWTSEMFSPSFTNIRTELANLAYLPIMGNHEGSGSLFLRYFPQPYVAAGYWSFDYGPVHVVMMDQYTSYGTGSAEYNWVKSDLAATTKKWKVVMFHEPGWSANGGHPDNTTIQSAYEPLFEQYGVALVVTGHNHYYARAMVNGIPELTIGTGGAPLYTPQSGQPNVVFTYKGNGYAKFSINGSTLTGSFISSSGSTIDTFSVTR